MELHNGLNEELTRHARYAILPGDPFRVESIAALLEQPVKLAFHREYCSYLGYLEGEPVIVMSHGIGGPSTAIAVEELSQLGVGTMIRCGTCAGMQMEVKPGDCILVSGSIRQDGTAREYLPEIFPAIANFEVLTAMSQVATEAAIPHHVGVVHCKDSFWGQKFVDTMPMASMLKERWDMWVSCGVLGSEMESSTLFTVSSVRHIRAGAVMLCVWNQFRRDAGLPVEECRDTSAAARIAVETIRKLIKQDHHS